MPTRQPDLLDWQPPQPVTQFEPIDVRAASVGGRLARAISTALRDCALGRDEIAERMSAYLGKAVSKNMIDAYASPGRDTHGISAERLLALIHATGDRRLLELLAEPFGWAVIERRFLPLIELAAVSEREDTLRRQADALRRQLRSGGLL